MTLHPGDFLKNIKISFCDVKQGAGLFQYNGHPCYIFNKDIVNLTLRPGAVIDQLVCVRYDPGVNRFRCMIPGCCHNHLVNTLYFHKSKAVPYILTTYTSVWLDRWKNIVLNEQQVVCQSTDIQKEYHIPGRKWVVLKTAQWEMPVSVPGQFNTLPGHYNFFPSLMRKVTRNPSLSFIAPAYKIDQLSDKMPVTMEGQLTLTPEPKGYQGIIPLKIHLHSFLSPKKWHYGVWQHCFGHKNTEERQYWNRLFSAAGLEDIPEPTDTGKIFQNCKTNSENTSCAACDNNRYLQVHEKIAPYLYQYQKTAVTFFEQRMTHKTGAVLLSAEKLFDTVYFVQVVMKDTLHDTAANNESGVQLQHKGIFRGVLFADSKRGVLHLAPVTQYSTSPGALAVTLDRNIYIGTLRNVQKSN